MKEPDFLIDRKFDRIKWFLDFLQVEKVLLSRFSFEIQILKLKIKIFWIKTTTKLDLRS